MTTGRSRPAFLLLLGASLVVFQGCALRDRPAHPGDARLLGWRSDLGNGSVSSYAEFTPAGAPRALGLAFSARALEGLPDAGSDGHHCFDRDGNGTVDAATECLESYELVVPLPDRVARREDIPFKWVLLNWNPAGHIPPGIYDVPHFDVHFYMEPIARVFAITAGPCGPEFVRCDQYRTAKLPVPADYVPADFKDVDAVVPAMGNHLIDLTGAEFQKQPFTHSWIYGAHGGRIVFQEVMLARAFLLSRPDTCAPIKQPAAVAVAGFYPTTYCIRYDPRADEYTVSLEEFRHRAASGPAAGTGAAAPAAARPAGMHHGPGGGSPRR